MKKAHFIMYSVLFHFITLAITLYLEYLNSNIDPSQFKHYSNLTKPFFIGAFLKIILTNTIKSLKNYRPLNTIIILGFAIIYFACSSIMPYVI